MRKNNDITKISSTIELQKTYTICFLFQCSSMTYTLSYLIVWPIWPSYGCSHCLTYLTFVWLFSLSDLSDLRMTVLIVWPIWPSYDCSHCLTYLTFVWLFSLSDLADFRVTGYIDLILDADTFQTNHRLEVYRQSRIHRIMWTFER